MPHPAQGTRGSFSEAGIRLGQLWWGLLSKAPPPFQAGRWRDNKQGLPAQPPALRPSPHTPSPSSAPHPLLQPHTPRDRASGNTLRQQPLFPGALRPITVLYFQEITAFSSCCPTLPPRPAPGVRGRTQRNCLCLYLSGFQELLTGDAPSPTDQSQGPPEMYNRL